MGDKKIKFKRKNAKVISADTQEKRNIRKQNTINYFKDLGLSFVKTKNLFRWGVRHWITSLLMFLVLTTCITLVPYFKNTELTADTVIEGTGISYSDQAIAYALSKDLKCEIKDAKLSCEEGFSYVETYTFTNDYQKTISYDIYVNATNVINERDDQEYFKVENFEKPGDNYIAFYEESFLIRYVKRSGDNSEYLVYKVYGFYNYLEGLNFSEVYAESVNLGGNEGKNHLERTAKDIVALGYKEVNNEIQFIQLSSNFLSYIILLAVVALLLKGNYMFNRKKGFKYSQCFKVAIMASAQSYIIALVLSLFGFQIMTMFGLALTIRALYLWLRYTTSKKNTEWLTDLYEFSKNERFLISNDVK